MERPHGLDLAGGLEAVSVVWHARGSGTPSLMHFAKCLKPYWRGILSRVRSPMHTGLPEGINNKIKAIECIAYEYRDDAYFFLNIRATFSGVGR